MRNIVGGRWFIEDGSLFMYDCTIEHDVIIEKNEWGFSALAQILSGIFPELDYVNKDHYIYGCTFIYTVFSLENE